MDRDGDLDIIMGGVFWYENPRPEEKPNKGPWKAHKIGSHRSDGVEVADVDGDCDLDVVTRGQSGFGSKDGNSIFFWKQNTPTSWSERVINCPHGEGLALADKDEDSDMDVVIAKMHHYKAPHEVSVYLNENKAAKWQKQVLSKRGSHNIRVGDIGSDGDSVLQFINSVTYFSTAFTGLSGFL